MTSSPARALGRDLVPRDRRRRLRRRARTPRSFRSTRCSSARSSLPFASEGALLVSAYAGLARVPSRARCGYCSGSSSSSSGARSPVATVWLLALFPAAVYFGAPYSESLFLLVSVGAFYAARTGHWAWAGALAAAASATRSAGLVLLVPLFLLWLAIATAAAGRGSPGSRSRRSASRPMRSTSARPRRRARVPRRPGGVVARVRRAVRRRLGRHDRGMGRRSPARRAGRARRSTSTAPAAIRSGSRAINVMLFAFLVFAAIALVGAFRRLPLPYGAYALAALALPLSCPGGPAAAHVAAAVHRRAVPAVHLARASCARSGGGPCTVASVVGRRASGLFTAQFASWEWIS